MDVYKILLSKLNFFFLTRVFLPAKIFYSFPKSDTASASSPRQAPLAGRVHPALPYPSCACPDDVPYFRQCRFFFHARCRCRLHVFASAPDGFVSRSRRGNLDQLKELSSKLKAKTIRVEAPSQLLSATR